MTNVTAILSMLHEPPSSNDDASAARNSATRFFRQDPVLSWTLDRLSQSRLLGTMAILCWADQVDAVTPLAAEQHAHVLVKTPRVPLPSVEAIAAAQRWSDGWRGGLLGTCEFDAGFHGPWIFEIVQHLKSDAALLIDPASGLVDAEIIDSLIEQAMNKPDVELFFAPAPPGIAGVLLRPALVERLAQINLHPGRLLHYMPDHPMRDPLGGDGCVTIPTPVARTTRRFRLDTDRQIQRVTEAAVSLNGTLIESSAEEMLCRFESHHAPEAMPRDVVLELTTCRATNPIFWPGKQLGIARVDATVELVRALLDEIAASDDTRLTLGGVGDPLMCDAIFEIIAAAREAGVRSIHVETDLLADEEQIERLADSDIDVVSVHLPAMTQATYAAVMRTEPERFAEVIENIRRLVARRHERRRGVPLVVPTFVKCAANLGEMEAWYDQWLRALGCAVIAGPSDYAGQIAPIEIADMSPPKRKACARLNNRITILCDGTVVACEQDVLGKAPLGNVGDVSLLEIWQKRLSALRNDHACRAWAKHPLCGSCREWNRP